MTDATDAALELLRSLGAAEIAHPGGHLLTHLVRTHDQLAAWDQAPEACLAGLCHAAYGTDGFPTALLGLDERPRLRAVIGEDAERLVHDYGTCDRRATYPRFGELPLPLTDRFTGATRPLDDTATTAFAGLTIVNELDIVRHGDLGPDATAGVTALVRALVPCAPTIARRALAELAPHGPSLTRQGPRREQPFGPADST